MKVPTEWLTMTRVEYNVRHIYAQVVFVCLLACLCTVFRRSALLIARAVIDRFPRFFWLSLTFFLPVYLSVLLVTFALPSAFKAVGMSYLKEQVLSEVACLSVRVNTSRCATGKTIDPYVR